MAYFAFPLVFLLFCTFSAETQGTLRQAHSRHGPVVFWFALWQFSVLWPAYVIAFFVLSRLRRGRR